MEKSFSEVMFSMTDVQAPLWTEGKTDSVNFSLSGVSIGAFLEGVDSRRSKSHFDNNKK